MPATRKFPKLGRYIRPALLAIDWLLFNLVFGVVLWLFPELRPDSHEIHVMLILINIGFIPVLIGESRRDYFTLRAIRLERTVLHALCTVGLHALFFLSFIALLDLPYPGIGFYGAYYLLVSAVIVIWSLISRKLLKMHRRRGYNYTRVVIVGTNSTAMRLASEMDNDPGYGYRIMGFFDEECRPGFHGHYCGTIDRLDSYVHENNIDQIYFTMPGHDATLTRVVKIADDNVAEFFYVPQISRYISRGFQVVNIGAMPVLTVRRNPLKKTVNRALKRSFDFVTSSIFLCLYPLIYIPVAIAIKMSSPGPVYFKQERTGYKGRPFNCLKFRTMRVNVDADRAQATKDDPRKTRLGDFLRRSSLDELPQFINVWKGDMSIVGPRPHMLKHTEEYSQLVDRYMVRHLVKPGITGWAQVNGYRGQTDVLWKMEKRVEYDVWYIENWNFLLDLRIMVRTALNMFRKDKNAF
ncbi:MAG: undecaprenyl-phosphate glucose phosphotransferase [Muribaculaceae bacterium]|nr:undecaprenyl-phosphate glucose phosphotransferase [Muribaculaceae bacterium]